MTPLRPSPHKEMLLVVAQGPPGPFPLPFSLRATPSDPKQAPLDAQPTLTDTQPTPTHHPTDCLCPAGWSWLGTPVTRAPLPDPLPSFGGPQLTPSPLRSNFWVALWCEPPARGVHWPRVRTQSVGFPISQAFIEARSCLRAPFLVAGAPGCVLKCPPPAATRKQLYLLPGKG